MKDHARMATSTKTLDADLFVRVSSERDHSLHHKTNPLVAMGG